MKRPFVTIYHLSGIKELIQDTKLNAFYRLTLYINQNIYVTYPIHTDIMIMIKDIDRAT